jgi:hypothetical protein
VFPSKINFKKVLNLFVKHSISSEKRELEQKNHRIQLIQTLKIEEIFLLKKKDYKFLVSFKNDQNWQD